MILRDPDLFGFEIPLNERLVDKLEGEGAIFYVGQDDGEAIYATTPEWDIACMSWPVHPIAAILYWLDSRYA